MLFTVSAYAAPTVSVTVADVKGQNVVFKVLYTSDGTDAAAVDICANMDYEASKWLKSGPSMVYYTVDPGLASVAPNGAFDIIISDITGVTIYSTANNAIEHNADSGPASFFDNLSGFPLMMTTKTYLTVEDLGDAGDQVTFYIYTAIRD